MESLDSIKDENINNSSESAGVLGNILDKAKHVAGVVSMCALLYGAPAYGQPKQVTEEKAPKVKIERGKGGKKVYRITEGFIIEGRIQKPNAFYVLQRSSINYDWASLKKNFVPRILEAVRKSPF